MDAVYVLGRGSTWADNELRYSLRALVEFVEGIDRVVVVGHRPEWLCDAVHLPCRDIHACKERNILDKILVACRTAEVSREFLFMNDDHLALLPQLARVPNWYAGELLPLAERLGPRHRYGQAVRNTAVYLNACQCPSTWNFDIHTPIVYDKELFPEVMGILDWDGWPRGFVLKSWYANMLELPATPLRDVKLVRRHSFAELVGILRGRPWWSMGPSALNINLQRLLAELYPEKSPFEI